MKIKTFVFIGIAMLIFGYALKNQHIRLPLYFMGSSLLFYAGIKQLKKARRLHRELKTNKD